MQSQVICLVKNIERAIKKGAGILPGMQYEEIIYEGYGPGGVAILLNVITDNKNRSVAEIRHYLFKIWRKIWGKWICFMDFSKKKESFWNKEIMMKNLFMKYQFYNDADDIHRMKIILSSL